jgi:hypothetical protein
MGTEISHVPPLHIREEMKMHDLIATSNNVRLLKFDEVFEVWTCPAWGVDFKRSGPVYREYGKALAAARNKARKMFGQELDIDEPAEAEVS